MLIAGVSGGARNGAAALAVGRQMGGVCAQERVTRVRGAGVNGSGIPDEALDLLLGRLGRSRRDVERYAVAAPARDGKPGAAGGIDHHFAHACTAYLSSPFMSAAIVVCDHEWPHFSVWEGKGGGVTRVEWPWSGPGFADIYSHTAAAFGFDSPAGGQRLEALARLRPNARDDRAAALIDLHDDSVIADPSLGRVIEERLAGDRDPGSGRRAELAGALQARMAELLLTALARVRDHVPAGRLCLCGSLAYHSSMNTAARQSGLFADVFVPVDPGDAGLAVGIALHSAGIDPTPLSPFLGPSYSSHEIKETLDNCKLQYSWESEEAAIGLAVRALQQGRLVGWFDDSMEWGVRALGARCILASPFAPYVLENLNTFLKKREPWRGYALSGLDEAVGVHFEGPASAPFMECDYRPRDPATFRHVLPAPGAAVRVHTVGEGALPRFRRLLEAFGEATGLPFLVNTSFNGFHEPIVCSPRDAVRVFYGSGLDLLVMDQFVLGK